MSKQNNYLSAIPKLPDDYNDWDNMFFALGKVKKNNIKSNIVNSFMPNLNFNYNNNLPNKAEVTKTNYAYANDIRVANRVDLKKIKINKIKLQKVLDLHNCLINEAKEKIIMCLEECKQKKIKHVLIITGKGLNSLDKNNTIKTNFLNWLHLQEFKQYIHTYSPALNKHGGEGAFYLWLKS